VPFSCRGGARVPSSRGGRLLFSRRAGARSAAAFRRPGAAWGLVAWIAAWLVAAPAAAQAPSLATWPDPQVEVALPAGWHRLETAWVAERILLATPSPVEANDVAALDEIGRAHV